jgi:hypothetical protein
VVAELKNKVYQMLDVDKNRKFKMSSKDELFNSLLNARNNSQETVMDRAVETAAPEYEAGIDEDQAEQEEMNQYIGR